MMTRLVSFSHGEISFIMIRMSCDPISARLNALNYIEIIYGGSLNSMNASKYIIDTLNLPFDSYTAGLLDAAQVLLLTYTHFIHIKGSCFHKCYLLWNRVGGSGCAGCARAHPIFAFSLNKDQNLARRTPWKTLVFGLCIKLKRFLN